MTVYTCMRAPKCLVLGARHRGGLANMQPSRKVSAGLSHLNSFGDVT